jgi:DNA repair protein RecO (recombination protein O)
MIQTTKGIVLRSVKYGETSLVVTIFTELFGLQSYLVNGVRTASKKGSSKSAMFQPSAILELVAYHNEFKNLQRLKEYKWDQLYHHIFSDIWKNAVAVFMIELLTKSLKEPEPNPDLFYFTEDALMALDNAAPSVAANMPLFFALHLAGFFGFQISDEYSCSHQYLDLEEGRFVTTQPQHANYLEGKEAEVISQLLKTLQPADLAELPLNHEFRRKLLQWIELFYAINIQDFGTLKTLPVLRELAR